jgi:two-component system, sensor histidine kinase and response regulator
MVNGRLSYTPGMPAEIGKANILIVDDHPENLLALEAMLEDLGQNLVKATSPEAALLRVLDMEFAVILLDVQMPTLDGFEVASIIRERDRSRNVPIIFLTAIHRLEENIFRGYEVGAVDYLFKPLVPEILRAKVGMFVKMWQQTWEIRQQAEHLDRANLEKERQLRELKRLNRELEALKRELESVSYSVTHDLHDPLQRINGYATTLLEGHFDKLDAEGQDYLQLISGMCNHITHLINDILELSHVTRVRLESKIVNLSVIATQIAEQYRTDAPQRDVKFNISGGLYINGDQHLLTILIENLIGNAWKFTQHRKAALIEVGAIADEDDHLIYFVRDNGIGFDMRFAYKLFGAFQRLHSEFEFEGNGVGLAISQRIVQRHGGKIWAEAKRDQGAAFYFTL